MSCTGRCLSAADIGLPEYSGSMYAVDPDCLEHGDGHDTPLTPEEEEMAPPDVEPGPCPCGDFEPADHPNLCVCGHWQDEHRLCDDETSWWCEVVIA